MCKYVLISLIFVFFYVNCNAQNKTIGIWDWNNKLLKEYTYKDSLPQIRLNIIIDSLFQELIANKKINLFSSINNKLEYVVFCGDTFNDLLTLKLPEYYTFIDGFTPDDDSSKNHLPEVILRDSLPNGKWYKYCFDNLGNPKIKFEKQIKNHLLEGKLKYYKNGNLYSILNYEKGREKGVSIRFYPDGNVSSVGINSDYILYFNMKGALIRIVKLSTEIIPLYNADKLGKLKTVGE